MVVFGRPFKDLGCLYCFFWGGRDRVSCACFFFIRGKKDSKGKNGAVVLKLAVAGLRPKALACLPPPPLSSRAFFVSYTFVWFTFL